MTPVRGRPPTRILASLLGLVLLVAACGEGGVGSAGVAPSDDPSAPTTTTPTPAPPGTAPDGPGPPADALPGTVTENIDGDTVRIDFGDATESVRLIGIDTPEPTGGFQPAECFGDEASAYTRDLIPVGTAVLVTFDAEPRDRFDRLLGYVYRASDGLFVNLGVVESGFAGPMSIAPNTTFSARFEAAAADAAAAGLGLWAGCDGPDDLVDPGE